MQGCVCHIWGDSGGGLIQIITFISYLRFEAMSTASGVCKHENTEFEFLTHGRKWGSPHMGKRACWGVDLLPEDAPRPLAHATLPLAHAAHREASAAGAAAAAVAAKETGGE